MLVRNQACVSHGCRQTHGPDLLLSRALGQGCDSGLTHSSERPSIPPIVIRRADRVPPQGTPVRPLIPYGKTTTMTNRGERVIRWAAGSREALREMPERVRWLFGRALFQLEIGRKPMIASALRGQLQGVLELRADHDGDTFRLYYTLKCPGLVYVLYCQKKKSKRGRSIPKHERDLIVTRYRESLLDCIKTRGGVR